jgi:hypothetical protein
MAFAKQLGQWVKTSPNQVTAIGLALLVIALAGWTGFRARKAAVAVSAKRVAWESTVNQLAMVRQQFKAPTTTEAAALIEESSRMGVLAVPAEERLNLVDMVGRLAEACALGSVRVVSVPANDSLFKAERHLSGAEVKPAQYSVAVEFTGSFANAQKFVISLPPSVSLARMVAARRAGGTWYKLVLSVYELDANSGT